MSTKELQASQDKIQKEKEIAIELMRDILKCERALSQKHDVRIRNKEILILEGYRAKKDLGSGSWGKIDFLEKNGYTIRKVGKF